ncbi:mucin-4-like isoform X2 [Anthonomus grandis grandis]|uniref:mucin-4-like isoform X2 n=1 Tax=Anthonomus grandis grandis TaxID=2921223 RepID=UPI002165B212|nr:mucin-4-like isoform X2 [Anthonomus grandis grandis]
MISTGICRWLFLLISLSTWTRLIDSKEMRIVCYYTNWSIYRPGQAKFSPQNINPYLCTHLIYAFGGFTKENTLKPFDKYQDIEKGGYAKFTGLKTYNKNLKTMIAIGGWNEGSSRFSPMVASADRRKELVRNAVKFLRQNHFDGLDLDWEYPSFRDGGKPRDRDNYAQLVKELREEFERESEKTGRPRLLLTMAVPAGIEYINKGYDVPKLTKYLDWMNILSYDYHSAYEPAVNHHAPLYPLEEENEYNYDTELNIDYTIKHYLKLGADPNKLVLGIPTYGRSYTLFNPDAYEIGSPADGPGNMGEYTRENGYLAYYEICEYIKEQDWEVEDPNPEAMGPIAFKENQWVGYDDENIVRKKAEYVVENKLGGIMFWAIDNDDFRGTCHGKPYPLIEAAKEAMLNAYGITEENLISPPSKPTKRPKTKSKTRTTTTTEQPEDENSVKPSRRRRIKTKSKQEERPSTTSQKRRKTSSKKTEGGTSTYSSLKIATPAYTTPEPPATPDMGGGFKCEDEGFFPHPKDCKKYYWCLNGAGDTGIIAHQFTCPAGLYFNKAADSCDYSQNVLCNKKLQKASTTPVKETTTKASTTESSVATSTTVKVASKSAFNFRTSTTTTEAYEYEEEYEDEEEENAPHKKEEPEEDPKVIKELLDLIRKAGGIEELEKQLKIKDAQTVSSSDSTTPSAISKSIFERVLGKTSKNTLNAFKRTSINRNSGGPQGSDDTKEEEEEKKVDRGRPQYKTLSRQRSTTEKPSAEEEEEEEQKPERKSFRAKSSLEYVNIRRPKASTTTETPEDNFQRNKILGETDPTDESDEEATITQKSNFPQYVNIRRQRPSTTSASPEPETKYVSVRRTTTASALAPDNEDEQKYEVERRGTTTTEPATEENEEVRRRSTISPETADNIESKYSTIRRSTTSSPVEDNEPIKSSLDATTPEESTTVGATPTESNQQDSNDTITDTPESQTLSNLITITESVNLTSTQATESNSGSSTITEPETNKKKRPALYQPRPFSFGSTTSKPEPTTTTATKVSQTFKFRVRPTSSSSSSSTTEPSPATVRTRTRFNKLNRNLNEDSEQEEKYQRTVETKPRTRKRIATTTATPVDFNEEYNRKYRPVELADLSSLTAVDLRGGFVSKNKRRRPVATTTSEKPLDEAEKTGPRTITLARKALGETAFGKSRRVVEEPASKTTTTTKPSLRPRKIIRKFKGASSTTPSAPSDDISSNSVTAPKRKRIPIFRQRTTTESTSRQLNQTDEEPGEEEDENIKLSESNIRESSHVNTLGFEEKPGKYRFGKSKEVVSSYGGKLDASSTAPTRILRTRKIIRKFNESTESEPKKRFFRGRTSALQSLSDQLQDDKDRNIFSPTRSSLYTRHTTSKSVEGQKENSEAGLSTEKAYASNGLSLSLYNSPTVKNQEEKEENEGVTGITEDSSKFPTSTEESVSLKNSLRLSPYNRHTFGASNPAEEENEEEKEANDTTEEVSSQYDFSSKKTFTEKNTTEEPTLTSGRPRLAVYTRHTSTSTTSSTIDEEEEKDENSDGEITEEVSSKFNYSPKTSFTDKITTEGPTSISGKLRFGLYTRHTSITTPSAIEKEEEEEEDSDSETTEEIYSKYNFSPKKTFTGKSTTEEPASTSANLRLGVYTRHKSTTTTPSAIEEEEEEEEEDSDDETTEEASSKYKFSPKKTFTVKSTTQKPTSTSGKVRLGLYTRHTSTTSTPNAIEEEDIEEYETTEEELNFSPKKTFIGESTTEEPTSTNGKLRLGLYTRHTSTTSNIFKEEEGEDNDDGTTEEVSSKYDFSPKKISTPSSTSEEPTRHTPTIHEEEDDDDFFEEELDCPPKQTFTKKNPTEEATTKIRLDLYTRHTSTTTTSNPSEEEDEEEDDDAEEEDDNDTEYNSLTEKSPTEESSSTNGKIRLSLYTRHQTSTAPTPIDEEENTTGENSTFSKSSFDTEHDASPKPLGETEEPVLATTLANKEEDDDDDDDAITETDPLKYTVYTSSIGRTHQFESNTNFNEENDTKTVNSSRLMSALNTRNESHIVINENDVTETTDKVPESTTEYHRRSTLRPVNGRPKFGFTRKTASAENQSTKRAFGKGAFKKPSAEVTRRSFGARPTTPLPLNKLLYRYSSTHNEPTSTTARIVNKPAASELKNDLDVDTEAIKARNKNLFAKRKMNTPAVVSTTTEPPAESTEAGMTTLHHIFAELTDSESATETMLSASSSPETSSKVERLIEVNRIVQVQTNEDTKVPTVDKIGEISRITLIKIVEGNNETVIMQDPVLNEILRASKPDPAGQREDRKYEIFGDSKVANSKDLLVNPSGKPEIIDGISHINVVTPKPLLVTEASTISLQGLFQTEKPHLNPSFTTSDEVLEGGLSEFVNVRVLNGDEPNTVPIKVLNEEESTIQAHVMEISPKPDSRTIKIVPIKVEMARSVRVPHK